MLAPGDLLTIPPGDPKREKPADSRPKPPDPAPRAEEPEPQSFLLTLLRALGAIHT
jgi:hypothetical protein